MKELSLHILDLVQNAIRAKALKIEIEVTEDQGKDLLTIGISDDGEGMTAEILKKALDPFYTSRTTRKVGLGIPLFKQVTVQCEGSFEISSTPGKGTRITGSMKLNHLDRQPLGDIAGVMVLLLKAEPAIQFIYRHTTSIGKYTFDTEEIWKTLGINQINNPELLNFIREMIRENLKEIVIRC